jgi:hypothetical protein
MNMKIAEGIKTGLAIIGGLAVAGALFLLVIYVVVPSFYSPEKEVFRLASPDNKIDAVVSVEEPGGFGSSHVRLYIASHGKPFDKNDDDYKFAEYHSHTILIDELRWLSPNQLQLMRKPDDDIYVFHPKVEHPSKVLILLTSKVK